MLFSRLLVVAGHPWLVDASHSCLPPSSPGLPFFERPLSSSYDDTSDWI